MLTRLLLLLLLLAAPVMAPAGQVDSLRTSQVALLLAADGAGGDLFGRSIAAGGDTVAVGALGADAGGNEAQGAVYVFARNQGGPDAWGQAAKLVASDGMTYTQLGWSVAIDGDTIVAGANGDNDFQGAAYVFERNQGGPDAWGQVAKLVASDGAANDQFGWSVAIDGDLIVAGAVFANEGNDYRGAAYLFERNQGGPNAWGQVARLAAADGAAGDAFGYSVGVAGDTVIAGAPFAAADKAGQGAAYLFERNQGGPGAWGQAAKLVASDGAVGDEFGWSAAIAGDTAVAGAPHAEGLAPGEGAAYLFERNQGGPGAWGQAARLAAADAAENDAFGYSVAIAGDIVAAGTPQSDPGGSEGQGAVYLFQRNLGGPDAWGQAAKLTPTPGAEVIYFGTSVAVSRDGTWIAAGAPWYDVTGFDDGAAYVFCWEWPYRFFLPLMVK